MKKQPAKKNHFIFFYEKLKKQFHNVMTYNNLYQSRRNVILFLFIEVLKPVDIGSKVL